MEKTYFFWKLQRNDPSDVADLWICNRFQVFAANVRGKKSVRKSQIKTRARNLRICGPICGSVRTVNLQLIHNSKLIKVDKSSSLIYSQRTQINTKN